MATIEEDYVSFETAKLLKDKGFDELCECAYSAGGQYLLSCYKGIADRRIKNDEALDFSYSSTAPTLQMAMKWLREVYNFHIWIEPNHDKEGLYNAHVKVGWWSNNWGGVGYNTYEQACEAAIKYCLEHLI